MALKFRRGTTAQQSGSLAFGEPFVNTTLGTLLVGGPNGDIVLSTSGTGSTANFGAISGSGLDITGNANIAGNLTLGGKLTIGDATSDTVNVVASLSSSLIPSVTNAFDLGSENYFWRDLYISTGSIKFVGAAGTVVGTLSNAANGMILDSGIVANGNSSFGTSSLAVTSVTGSLLVNGNIRVTNGGITGSIAATNGVVSGSSQVIEILDSLNTFSGSALTRFTEIGVVSGSLITSASAAKTTNDSQDVSITNLNSTTASLNTSVSNLNSTTASLLVETANLELFSGSQLTQNSALATISGSLISTASNHEQRIAANEAVSSSYVRNNSTNTFNGNQTISGSLIVTQDLTILGSSSIQNISSSTLDIGTNLITVNVNQPAVRFGGLAVIDSGSAGASGSFLYDAVQDEFIFVHKGNGTNVTSSHFLLGPETYDNLGNESYIGQHRIIKGAGNEHVAVSNIFDDGTTISLGSNVDVTGSIVVSGNVDGVDISVFNSNVNSTTASLLIETANLETFSGSTLTRLTALESSASTALSTNNTQATSITNLNSTTASLLIETANLEAFTSSINTTIKSKLDADGVISSSAQLTTTFDSRYLNTGGDGVVSGSSQIAFSGVTGTVSNAQLANSTISGIALGSNLATLTIGTGLSGTSYNGSGAVTIANTGVLSNVAGTGVSVSGATGNVTISIGQAVATSSNVQFNSLGIGMAASATAGRIDATNDIVAFSSSDIRFKENIKPIENAIDKIRKISGNTYDWKEENKIEHGYEGNDVGVIAQEIEAVLPQLVQTRESGYKAVKYDKLVALLIEGIKEQQLQIEKLQLEVEDLKKQKGL